MNSISICPRKNILSSSDGVDIMIWKIPSLQEIIDDTRERFKERKLTSEERRRYYIE
jgi:phosphopantetheinyl transferase (holo-ACP synthase)